MDLANPPRPSSSSAQSQPPTLPIPSLRQPPQAVSSATTARRKRELDEHARDMQWNWANEDDLEVFKRVSLPSAVAEGASWRRWGGSGLAASSWDWVAVSAGNQAHLVA